MHLATFVASYAGDTFVASRVLYKCSEPAFQRSAVRPVHRPNRRGAHSSGVSERRAATTTKRDGTGCPRRSRVRFASCAAAMSAAPTGGVDWKEW